MPDLRQLIASRPRVDLGCFPTPLQSLSRLTTSTLQSRVLLVKRDDLTDLAMGGNKVRKLEFFLGEALEQGARVLVTVGSLHSNHCRLAAAAAARCGLECHLLIIGRPEEGRGLEGNRLLSTLLGARLFHVDRESARKQIYGHLARLRRGRVSFYFIPGGGHCPTGVWGYLEASLELTAQLEERNRKPDRIYVTCGTGTTQAGLLLGLRLLGWPTRITGVSVARSAERCHQEIRTVIGEFCVQMEMDNPVSDADIEIDERWIGAGYEDVPLERWQLIVEVARRDALLLDPLYTGRTMQALFDYLSQRDGLEQESSGDVVFVHTGGLPGLFVPGLQSELAAALAAAGLSGTRSGDRPQRALA